MLLTIGAGLGVALVLYTLIGVVGSQPSSAADKIDEVADGWESPLARTAMKATKPLSSSWMVLIPDESPLYKSLRMKLLAAGMFKGHVEAFLSAQFGLLIVGVSMAAAAAVSDLQGMTKFLVLAVAILLPYAPWSRMKDQASKRAFHLQENLADFATNAVVPMASGVGLIPALASTAEKVPGPVADEVKDLLHVLGTRARDEEQAFADAGDNLGTDEARTLFATLSHSHIEGVKVVDTLRAQADQLRKTHFEAKRANIGKTKVKITMLAVVSSLPLLFVLLLFPAGFSLQGSM